MRQGQNIDTPARCAVPEAAAASSAGSVVLAG